MLNTTDVVKVADSVKKELTKYYKTFVRPYLNFGPKDETVSEAVEVNTVDNGKVTVTLTSPKEKRTSEDASDLLSAAIEYFKVQQEADVTDATKRVDPVYLLLDAANDGLTAKLRMQVRNEIVPKVVDFDKATAKMADALMQRFPGKYKDVAAAVEALRALGM